MKNKAERQKVNVLLVSVILIIVSIAFFSSFTEKKITGLTTQEQESSGVWGWIVENIYKPVDRVLFGVEESGEGSEKEDQESKPVTIPLTQTEEQLTVPSSTSDRTVTSSVKDLSVSITVPEVVSEGEMISFSYIISSSIEQEVRFIPHIKCSSGVDDFLNEEIVAIGPDDPYQEVHSLVEVNYKWFENGYCTAYIYLIEPEQKTFTETFEIKVADHLDAEADTHAPGERGNKRVFLVGDVVEVRGNARTNTYKDAVITYTTSVTSTTRVSKAFSGKSFIMPLTKAGYYTVKVTASATGFMPNTAVTRFTVVKEHAKPTKLGMICNSDGICNARAGETTGNCALDCPLSAPVVSDDPFTARLEPESKPVKSVEEAELPFAKESLTKTQQATPIAVPSFISNVLLNLGFIELDLASIIAIAVILGALVVYLFYSKGKRLKK